MGLLAVQLVQLDRWQKLFCHQLLTGWKFYGVLLICFSNLTDQIQTAVEY